MKKRLVMAVLFLSLACGPALAEQAVSREEIETMKAKLNVLEQTVAKEGQEKPWIDRIDLSLSATGVVQGTAGVKDAPGAISPAGR